MLSPTATCGMSGRAIEGLWSTCATPPLGLVSIEPRIHLSFRSADQTPLLVTHNFHLDCLAELVHSFLVFPHFERLVLLCLGPAYEPWGPRDCGLVAVNAKQPTGQVVSEGIPRARKHIRKSGVSIAQVQSLHSTSEASPAVVSFVYKFQLA